MKISFLELFSLNQKRSKVDLETNIFYSTMLTLDDWSITTADKDKKIIFNGLYRSLLRVNTNIFFLRTYVRPSTLTQKWHLRINKCHEKKSTGKVFKTCKYYPVNHYQIKLSFYYYFLILLFSSLLCTVYWKATSWTFTLPWALIRPKISTTISYQNWKRATKKNLSKVNTVFPVNSELNYTWKTRLLCTLNIHLNSVVAFDQINFFFRLAVDHTGSLLRLFCRAYTQWYNEKRFAIWRMANLPSKHSDVVTTSHFLRLETSPDGRN